MKRPGVLLTVMVLAVAGVLFAAGCNVEEARQAGERAANNSQANQRNSEQQNAAKQASTPGETEAGSGETQAFTVAEAGEFDELMLTGGESSSGEPQPVSDFRMRMDEFSVAGSVSDAPEGTEVGVFWVAKDVPESEIPESKMSLTHTDERLSVSSVEVEGDQAFEIEYEWDPDPPWPWITRSATTFRRVSTRPRSR
ncbi:hypothetical protein BH23ACT11_BH23ACT11_28000 [soil metagenome]